MFFLLNILAATILALLYSMPVESVFATEIYSDLRGQGGLVICDEQSDCDAATEAIRRAENFFKLYGYVFNQSVNVKFKKSVQAALAENSAQQQETHGLYDPRTGWCEIPYRRVLQGKKIFGCNITNEFHISTITHEAAHHLYHLILKQHNQGVDRSLHEFVAYVVQIKTMKEPEKTKVLDLWPGEVLSGFENINVFVWAANPDRFAVMAYRFFLSNPEIMPLLLRGELKSGDHDE